MGKNPFERPWMTNNGAAAAAGGGGAIGIKGIIAGGITGGIEVWDQVIYRLDIRFLILSIPHSDLHHIPHGVRENAAATGRER